MNDKSIYRPNLKSGWYCVTCGGFVSSSFVDGFPVSRYWRPQTDLQVIEAFCSAACGLKDYEMRNAPVPTFKKDGYTRRRWFCYICKKRFSTIEVEVELRSGQSSMDALKEQYGKQIDRKELNKAIELLGRIRDGEI